MSEVFFLILNIQTSKKHIQILAHQFCGSWQANTALPGSWWHAKVSPACPQQLCSVFATVALQVFDKSEQTDTLSGCFKDMNRNKLSTKFRYLNLHMTPANRLNVLGMRTNGLTSIRTPVSVLTYTARSLPALLSGLSKIIRRACT